MTNTNKLFLVFETSTYEGDFIDEDVTKAFHTMEAAEAYVAELEAADKAKRVARARKHCAIGEGVPTLWEIKEIALV